jgi:hypothetical protein
MRRFVAVVVIATAAVVTGATAPSDLPIPRTVAEAEADGKSFLRADSVGLYAQATGTANRKCVEPFLPAPRGPMGPATQSGEILIGGTTQIPGPAGAMRSGAKIWWMPLHGANGALHIRGSRLASPTDTVRLTFTTIGHTGGGSMYPTNLHVPSKGLWMFVATSGRDWGCFLLSVY